MGKVVRCAECSKVYRDPEELEELRDNDSVCLVCNAPIEVTDWDRVLASWESEEATDEEDIDEEEELDDEDDDDEDDDWSSDDEDLDEEMDEDLDEEEDEDEGDEDDDDEDLD